MTNHELKEHEFEIMTDTWRLYKKYYEPASQTDFDNLVTEMVNLSEKYHNSTFCEDILAVFATDIDRRYKEKLNKKSA